jgi:phage gpG-like protein
MDVQVNGLPRVKAALNRVLQRMADVTPALETCGAYLEAQVLDEFATAGHGALAPLSPSTIAQRRRGSDRPLLDTGMLRASTQRGGGENVFDLRATRLEYGSAHPLAAVHQYGAEFTVSPGAKGFLAWRGPEGWIFTRKPVDIRIPARPFIPDPLTGLQQNALSMIIRDYASQACAEASRSA